MLHTSHQTTHYPQTTKSVLTQICINKTYTNIEHKIFEELVPSVSPRLKKHIRLGHARIVDHSVDLSIPDIKKYFFFKLKKEWTEAIKMKRWWIITKDYIYNVECQDRSKWKLQDGKSKFSELLRWHIQNRLMSLLLLKLPCDLQKG